MNRDDFVTHKLSLSNYICFVHKDTVMEKLRKKTKVMLAIEIVIYFAIAISLALIIILE